MDKDHNIKQVQLLLEQDGPPETVFDANRGRSGSKDGHTQQDKQYGQRYPGRVGKGRGATDIYFRDAEGHITRHPPGTQGPDDPNLGPTHRLAERQRAGLA
eukprot:EG_transcript_44365